MYIQHWEIWLTLTTGFHGHPGGPRFVFRFSALDTDWTNGPPPRANVLLLSSVCPVEHHWTEYSAEPPIEAARPILAGLQQLGLPNNQMRGGGSSTGSETWDHLTILLRLEDGHSPRQCILGGYDGTEHLSAELRGLLAQLLDLLGAEATQSWDVSNIREMLVRT
jgi:hypothetical protein